LLVRTGGVNMHNALQYISSTALLENLHSVGQDIPQLVTFIVSTELPDHLTLGKHTKTIQHVI
jgi:hypothetical protein